MNDIEIYNFRLLKFFLTDGVQDITAIEYKCINKIKNDLYPGYKILVKGTLMLNSLVYLFNQFNISVFAVYKE